MLWQILRNRQFKGLKFRRQVPIHPYTVDFFCAEKKLAVELDGEVHRFKFFGDRKRDCALESRGVRVIRFENEDVLDHVSEVLRSIALEAERRRPLSLSRVKTKTKFKI